MVIYKSLYLALGIASVNREFNVGLSMKTDLQWAVQLG